MQGIVNVYKPKGWTSFDVVNKLKRVYDSSKIGHLGTLDPMAEGVLPVALGKATKLFDFYLKKTKVYEAEFEFGYETDTLDADGEVIIASLNLPTLEEIKKATEKFLGKIKQVPPAFSAVKINGKRAYDLARNKEEFTISAKEVEVFKFECLGKIAENKYSFIIECSAGTYIRSLCRDLAKEVNSSATMTKLVRTRSGEFELKDSKKIEQIIEEPSGAVISLEKVFSSLGEIKLSGVSAKKVINGIKKIFAENHSQGLSRIYTEGQLFGIGEIKEGKLITLVRLYEGEN